MKPETKATCDAIEALHDDEMCSWYMGIDGKYPDDMAAIDLKTLARNYQAVCAENERLNAEDESNGAEIMRLKTAYDEAVTELTALREFVASLNSLAWEEWYGQYDLCCDGKFWIFDSDGNGVASGDNALEAVENFQKLSAGEGGGE